MASAAIPPKMVRATASGRMDCCTCWRMMSGQVEAEGQAGSGLAGEPVCPLLHAAGQPVKLLLQRGNHGGAAASRSATHAKPYSGSTWRVDAGGRMPSWFWSEASTRTGGMPRWPHPVDPLTVPDPLG